MQLNMDNHPWQTIPLKLLLPAPMLWDDEIIFKQGQVQIGQVFHNTI